MIALLRRAAEIVLFAFVLLATTTGFAFAQPETEAPAPAPTAKKDDAKGITANLPCSACHTTAGWKAKDKAAGEEGTGFDHSKTGFPLTGQHRHATCVSCHDGKRAVKRACSTCHQDSHRGRLSQTCDQCHNATSWRQTKALEMHRMTRFPLTGMHVLADCTECHRRASEHQWTGAPIECFTCHEKDYRRPDLRPSHLGGPLPAGPPFPRDCSQCHRATAWAPAVFNPTLAAGRTSIALRAAPPNHDVRFPISFGVHRTATCEDCHAQLAVPRMVRCTGCHAHEPVRLAAQHKTTGGASSANGACLGCHPAGVRR